jgi:tRNA(Ile)-lysidine synthase
MLEWFLMQFTKGAGVVELLGMEEFSQKNNYLLVRPLLHVDKEDLKNFLHTHNIRYFVDATNNDTTYKRNHFRHKFAKPLLEAYKEGIAKSFSYLQNDKHQLGKPQNFVEIDEMFVAQSKTPLADMRSIDHFFKHKEILLSAKVKTQLQLQQTTEVSRKYVVTFYKQTIIIIPIEKKKPTLPKEFKEKCRKLQIEPKIRAFLYEHPEAFSYVLKL